MNGPVARQQNGDYARVKPTYVDYEDVFRALEDVRRGNAHGYGYKEEDASTSPPTELLTLNRPLSKPEGRGVALSYVLRDDNGTTPVPLDAQPSIQRTNCVTATFNAFAAALARGKKDGAGRLEPMTRQGGLTVDAYRRWLIIGNVPPEGGVSAVVAHNVGAAIQGKKIRRGDVLQIDWQSGGSHCVFCWDVATDGNEVFLQIVSSQTSTNGVGVVLSPEGIRAHGRLEDVIWRGVRTRQWVFTAPRDRDWLLTHEGREFCRRHGHFFREKGDVKKGDNGLLIRRYHAARFHRLFPRYPIALGGSIEVHTVVPGDPAVSGPARTRDASAELYFKNTEGQPGSPRTGGFYPVGASRAWHGGVHLYPAADALRVHAPTDGFVVAARLATPENKGPLGDSGFVLLKTRLKVQKKEIAFFTLLFHLAPVADDDRGIPWLEEIRHVPPETDHRWQRTFDPKKRYYGILDAPSTEGPSPRKGEGEDGSLTFYSKQPRNKDEWTKPDLILGGLVAGEVLEAITHLDASGWAHLKALEGPLAGKDGWVYGEGRLERVFTHSLDTELRDARTKLLEGEVVDFSKLRRKIVVRAGEILGTAGTIGPDRGLHFEVFSSDLIGVNFDPERAAGKEKQQADVDAGDGGLFMDRKEFEKTFFDLLQQADKKAQPAGAPATPIKRYFVNEPVQKDADQLTKAEVCAFYAESVLAPKLRVLVTKHHSEWGDGIDWNKMETAAQWKHVPAAQRQAFRDDLKFLQWWTAGLGSDAGLPDDQVVFHYHPIEFMKWLDFERDRDADGELHASVFDLNHDS